MGVTLATRIKISCMSTFASEHLQIADLIRRSSIHLVDSSAAKAARDVVMSNTLSIEKNLDLIELPDTPTWFEWPLPTRNGRPHSAAGDERTGCLIAPHPFDENLHLVVSSWEIEQVASHSYGIAIIDKRDLSALAEDARHRLFSSNEDSIARIMSMIVAFVPPAFRDEMIIISDGQDQTTAALRDATADVPLMLTLLLLCKVKGGLVFKNGEDDTISVEIGNEYIPTPLSRVIRSLTRAKPGIVRLDDGSGAWVRPSPNVLPLAQSQSALAG